MDARLIAALVLSPFLAVFVYATVHELVRWKKEGRAQYGLTFDEETGTSHVTALDEDDDGFDPAGFDPDEFNAEAGDDTTAADAGTQDGSTRGA